MTQELTRRRLAALVRPTTRLIRVGAATIAAAVVLLQGSAHSSAQGGPPPDFSPVGLAPDRSYFSAAPFEAIDMINGDVNLTFTDLVLPGNAGFNLQFVRTYNHQTGLWRFGLAGIPWRIGIPEGSPNDSAEYPQLFMADGSLRKLLPRDGTYGSDVFLSEEFWRYTKSTRTLEMPNGWIATFEDGNPSGGVMVAEVHDPFGNSIDFDWEGGAETDIRPLRLNGVFQTLGSSPTRTVEFRYDDKSSECGMIPRKMIYLGREWSYDCEFASPELQAGWRLTKATPPVGPAWEYAYDDGNDGSVTVTTPQGGEVKYQFAEQILPPYLGIPRAVISSRTTDGPDIDSGMWQFSLNEPPGGQAFGTVTTPSGRQIEFLHGWKPFKQNWLLDRKIVRDSGGAEVARVELDYTDLSSLPAALTGKAITQDGVTYTTTYDYHDTNYGDYRQPWRITESGQKERVTERTFDYEFDASSYFTNRVASETVRVDGQSFTSSYEYENATAFLEAETKAGVRTTFGRDAYGNRNRTTDANDHSTTATFDYGVAKDTTTPEYEIHRSINSDGTVAWEETRDQNHRTHFTYDDLGRVEMVSPPGVTATETNYNETNGREIETKRGARVTTAYLDGFGRQIRTVDSAGVQTSTRYDAEGYVTYEGAPYSSIDRGDTLTYDAIGRLRRRTHPGGSYVEYTYSGHSVAIRDEEDHTTTQVWEYFGAPSGGRLAQVTDAAGKTWQYSYHPLGMLTGVAPPDGAPGRSWHYNGKTFLDSETHPESGTVTYTLDNVGNVLTKRDANQQDFTYTYDGLNRLRTIDAPGTAHDVEIRYEGPNRKEMWNSHVFSEFHYDASDRLRERTDRIIGQSFTTLYDFDGLDNLTRIEYPNHRKVRYDIDPDNGRHVTRVYEENGTIFADQISYHASGAISDFRSGNGLTNHVGFDLRSRPDEVTAGPLHLTYAYDNAGNVRSITDARPEFSQTFDYDAVDRLTHVYGSFGATAFTYYADGNRKTKGDVNYTYSPLTNRLRQVTGSFEAADYGYDDNGNLDEAPGTTFTYTPFNMMETFAVTNAQTQVISTTTYRYDADNMRALRLRANGGSDYFVHGLSGDLLAEYAGTPTGVRWKQDYIYLGSRLLASVEAPLATVAFEAATSSVFEGVASHPVWVKLTTPDGQALDQRVTVAYATVMGGTAGPDQDYTTVSGTVTFEAGAPNGDRQPIVVPLRDDTQDENDETFTVALSSPVGAELGASSHTVTIRDNEPHLFAAIRTPDSGAVLLGNFTIIGFAFDRHAASGVGVDRVDLYARQPGGGGTPIPLGTAIYGESNDEAASFGEQFRYSGFRLTVLPPPPGPYEIYASAHFTINGSTQNTGVVPIVVRGPRGVIEEPVNAAVTGQPFLIRGYAVDLGAPTGTGVNGIRVYAVKNDVWTHLGDVTNYGLSSDAAAGTYGERYRNSGYSLEASGLAPGTYTIWAYARSTLTGAFDMAASTGGIRLPVPDVHVTIEEPAANATSTEPFVIRGWAVDLAHPTGPGVSYLAVYATPVNGGGSIVLGPAYTGSDRPAVATQYGQQFLKSGWEFTVSGLPPGDYTFSFYPHSTVSGTEEIGAAMNRRLTVRNDPRMVVDLPANGALVGQPFLIRGYALDRGATTGTGVDAVRMYAVRQGTSPWIDLGSGTYGIEWAAAAAAYGERYRYSGYYLYASGLTPGTYDIYVYARTVVTNGFDLSGRVTVTIPNPDPRVVVDTPVANATVFEPVTFTGWAADLAHPTESGVSNLTVYAYPDGGGAPIVLGTASTGLPRPDIAAQYGARFSPSGWKFSVNNLPAGTYTFYFYPFSTVSGTQIIAAAGTRRVVVRNEPRLIVEAPANNSVTAQPFEIRGWAIDPRAASGTGVDIVDVYAHVNLTTMTYLGRATYGLARQDLADQLGERWRNSGFTFTTPGGTPLPSGTHNLWIYARSTFDGNSSSARVTVTIPTPNIRIAIDAPAADATVTQPFTVTGYAIDLAHPTQSGVSYLAVYATPVGGGPSVVVGAPVTNLSRPDVGAQYGTRFTPSGFSLNVSGLAPGTYTFSFYPFSTVVGTQVIAAGLNRRFTVRNDPRVSVTGPPFGTGSPPFQITGWAIDRAAASGTGVDAINVYAVNSVTGAWTHLGAGTYGVDRPDIAATYGSQFRYSGFTFTVTTLSPGTYTIWAYARTLLTGGYDAAGAVTVSVPWALDPDPPLVFDTGPPLSAPPREEPSVFRPEAVAERPIERRASDARLNHVQ